MKKQLIKNIDMCLLEKKFFFAKNFQSLMTKVS